jgi:antagonist of KipI
VNAVMEVLSAGVQTTVQDLGRWGYQASGVPIAGPMDPFAHRLANALVGNPRHAATLEIALVGPVLQFHDARALAVAGAEFDVFLDGVPVPPESVVTTQRGATLRFGTRRGGARAYLAVGGGFDVPAVLGSRATHIPTGTGGWKGRALLRGDRLPLGPSHQAKAPTRLTRRDERRRDGAAVVRVLPGPQDDRFTPGALDALVSAPYQVGVDSDRMGFRLAGPALRHRAGADIISDATPLGSVQVPASGQPLLLMADRPTTGGYAKLATVISADIGVAGQAAPGDLLQFAICSRAEAFTALVARERPLLTIESGPA